MRELSFQDIWFITSRPTKAARDLAGYRRLLLGTTSLTRVGIHRGEWSR